MVPRGSIVEFTAIHRLYHGRKVLCEVAILIDMEWINLQLVFLITHIFGAVLGAGAAFTGDFIFLTSVRDKHLSSSEARIMDMTSRVVWIGILVLLLSGIGLVTQRPEIFLNSEKFWAKMTIVGIIVANGLVFYSLYKPVFRRSIGKEFLQSSEIIKMRAWIVMSGAVSAISWSFAIILGVLGRVPFSYFQIIGFYAAILTVAVGVAVLLRKKIIPTSTA
ncbi:MAG: hypothetical protein WD967_00300 [Candidatus Levyibacteriota bacterium]